MLALIRFGISLVALALASPAGAVTCASNVSAKCECDSLFAYRVLELAHDLGATPADCNAALTVDVGRFSYLGLSAICTSGQTANGCRTAWYATPPVVANLGNGGRSHQAKFLPRCADGSAACLTDEVVCQDGTRPLVYMDKALDVAGNDVDSNAWVFFLGGEGKPCADLPVIRNGMATSTCWSNYRFGGPSGKNEFKTAMSSMHPDFRRVDQSISATGIVDKIASFGGGATNNFRHFNRIKIERCTDWASDTEAMATVERFNNQALWDARTVAAQVPVWHRGLNHWRGLFHALTTTSGRDIDDDGTADLPTLGDATTILLAGSSDSTNWLISAADELRAELQSISPAVEVKIVVDGSFEPMLENEARYNANPWGGNLFAASLFDNPFAELLPPGAPAAAGRGYSNASFASGGTRRLDWDGRNTFLDESCELSHPGDPMQCYDAEHVLLNHVDTDFFIFAEQNDSVVGRFLHFADDRVYRPSSLTYRTRVRDQAEDIELAWGSRGEEAALVSPAAPGRSYFLPWGTRHTHLSDNSQMGKKMTECTDDGAGGWIDDTQPIAEVLHEWLMSGTSFFAIEDNRGAVAAASPHWVTGGGASCGHPRQDNGVPLP